MAEPFALRLELDPTSGQLRSLHDRAGALILACGQGPELAWNGVPLCTRLVSVDVACGEHITLLAALLEPSYGVAVELRIRRLVTVAGVLNHPGLPGSANLRYEVQRVPVESDADGLDYIWQPRIEAACRLDTLTVMAQPQHWFGSGTRLRNLAMGGSGPREHVSLEDGPIAEVIPWLQSGFRSVFPGQLTVNGGLYWHPEQGEPFVWVTCHRPATGGQIEFGVERHAYRFTYHRELALSEVVHSPAITLTWGRGLVAADAALARMFTAYVEPEPWWYRTTWYWLHPQWQPGGNFRAMGEGARILQQECGVNGFGLLTHTVPAGGSDVDMISPAPDHALGGDDELRRAVAGIRERGGRAFVWFSRLGHRPDTPARQNSWPVRGIDGRPIRTTYRAGAGVTFDVNNAADPSYQEYLMEWMEHYIKRIGVQGIFWDSGFQPLPADFGGKDYLRWPGEAAVSGVSLHDRLYRFGKSIDPDFFMWAEGISTDHAMNAFAVDARATGGQSTHRQMHRIAHAGPKRIVWRSAWAHELASGFPWIDPASDIHCDPGPETYRRVAADPMNRWICRTVAEHGCRSAIGLGDGISRLGDYLIRSPGSPESSVTLATDAQQLRHEITGALVTGTRTAAGLSLTLPTSGAWRLQA